jgi:hypothetical protein
LLPNSDANRTRLRQRFALLTFGFQRRSASVVLQAYNWNLSATTNKCDWYTDKNFGFQCQNELVTNIRASGVTGKIPPDLCWLTAACKEWTLCGVEFQMQWGALYPP